MQSAKLKPFRSRALDKIEKQITTCRDAREKLVLKARRAALLAHGSDVERARQEIAELRDQNKSYEPRLAAWIMFCDGIILYSESYSLRSALDRFKRANLFGTAVKDAELGGLSSSWMSYCYLAMGEVEQSIEYLKKSLEWSLANRLSALPRSYLIIADALSWAGDYLRARFWYNKARSEAAHQGDIVMQDTVIYNSAAFRVSALTLQQCMGEVPDTDAEKLAETELLSGITLNALIGNENNSQLTPMLKAELYTALGRWEAACAEYEVLFNDFGSKSLDQFEPRLLSQYAYCLAHRGQFATAREFCNQAISLADRCKELDDLFILHSRAGSIAVLQGRLDAKNYHDDAADFTLLQFKDFQSQLRGLLDPVLETEGMAQAQKNNPA